MNRLLERAAAGAYGEDSDAIGKLAGLVRSLAFEQGYGPFICGEMGPVDENGLAEGYLICPMYGADHQLTTVYRRIARNEIQGSNPSNSGPVA